MNVKLTSDLVWTIRTNKMTNNIWLNRVIFLSQFCIMRMHIERALFHQANKRNRCYLGDKCTQPKQTLFLMGIFQFISLTFFCELHAISHFTICSNKVAYSTFFLIFSLGFFFIFPTTIYLSTRHFSQRHFCVV